jgi:CRISPR-associated endonuclease/helicase Cas3
MDDEIVSEANLRRIVNAASAGQAVLVCCNTVRRAQEVYAVLKARLPNVKVDLLHSRFTARDRLQKEGALVKDPSKPARPDGVLVATQVVEVSLNLDFDTIFTEPAPLEALLQRFGRVNRLGSTPPVPVHVFREPTDGQHIYNPLMVQRTLAVLESANGEPVDESKVAAWLGRIYTGELLDEWAKKFDESAREFEATCIQTLRAFASDDALEDAFYRAFDNIDVLPACFEAEYNARIESNPILATEPLVGISWRQYARLKREGRVTISAERGRPPVVNAPYSSETGLSFDQPGD